MLIANINIPMPDTCHDCPFSKWNYYECECILTKIHFEDNKKTFYNRPKFCPLKEKKTS